jgi:predicted kinase
MPRFIMMIGVPSGGKSTLAHQLRGVNEDYYIVSRDNIVTAMGNTLNYNEAWKTVDHKQVDKLLNERLSLLLEAKKDIILDMTNLTKASRRRRLSQVSSEYAKWAMYFPLTYREMMQRAAIRAQEGKSIPGKVLTEMFESLEEPTKDEGFDGVFIRGQK